MAGYYFKCFILIVFGLGCSSFVSAEAIKLFVPEDFDVLYVNGVKQKNYLLNRSDSVSLNKGENQLVLRYKQFWGDDDDFEKVVSDDFLITCVVDDAGDYQLVFPALKNAAAASAYARQPSLRINNVSSGKAIDAVVQVLIDRDSLLPAVTLQGASSKDAGNTRPNVEQMMRLWEKASIEDRQAFLKKVL